MRFYLFLLKFIFPHFTLVDSRLFDILGLGFSILILILNIFFDCGIFGTWWKCIIGLNEISINLAANRHILNWLGDLFSALGTHLILQNAVFVISKIHHLIGGLWARAFIYIAACLLLNLVDIQTHLTDSVRKPLYILLQFLVFLHECLHEEFLFLDCALLRSDMLPLLVEADFKFLVLDL